MNNRQKIYKITCIIILIDQIVKMIIRSNIKLLEEIKVINNFFFLTHLENTGAAFSILEDSILFLIILSVLFIIIIDKFIKKEENTFTKIEITSLGLIIGGVYGNLIDRIIYHKVTDYISFRIMDYSFPVFNIADIAITVGTFLFIISNFFIKRKN